MHSLPVNLGPRTPSLISSISTDDGGFNGPTPEIKAKLKPPYTFDVPISPSPPSEPSPTRDEIDQTEVLHYADISYDIRLNPDGSESNEVYGETENYMGSPKSEPTPNGSIIYSTIKPDIPPPSALFFDQSVDESQSSSKISPESPKSPPRVVIAPLETNEEFEFSSTDTEVVPALPARPPPMLDDILGDVEFADADISGEEEDKIEEEISKGIQEIEEMEVEIREIVSAGKEELLPDAMTADEAERLLSSR